MQFDKLGPYRIGKKLGQGGMGAVYQGRDESTGQAAAVKVLSPHLAAEEGFRVRFEAEIESLKKLRHPNIVRLYGYGEELGYLFYGMELVDGTSLEEELRAGRRFHWREVTQLAIKLCRALKHAHDNGIIHRDIKPANLLLSKEGEIRLSDFGIARLFGNTRLTNDGGVLGTAEYMAPEQADGRPVTDRCDQYSLGGVMYALLAGRPPFRATSLVEMLQLQRFAEPQPVRRYAPDTPAELDRIIRQLLEKDPQSRFVNTLILARALEAMERGLSLSSQRSDFVLPHETDPAAPPSIDALGPTLVPHEPTSLPIRPESTAPGLDAANVFSVEPSPLAVDILSSAPVPSSGSVFTKVEDAVADASVWRDELRSTLSSWQTLAALAALAAIGFLAWQALEGPSADQLFGQIEAAADRHEPAVLKEAEPKLRDFLDRFPEDSRRAQVQTLLDEVDDYNQQRRVEQKSRKLKSTPAAERAYRDAAAVKAGNPELAIKKLQSLIDLYGSAEDAGHEDESVRLARTELKLLERQLAEDVRSDRDAIRAQLAVAERLVATDPLAARRIWQALITLYGDKSWATDEMASVRRELAKAAPAEPSDAGS